MVFSPTSMAVEIPGIHLGNPSWAVKSGAPQGRNVHDISYCEEQENILNGSRPVGRSWIQAQCDLKLRPPHRPGIIQDMFLFLTVRDFMNIPTLRCA